MKKPVDRRHLLKLGSFFAFAGVALSGILFGGAKNDLNSLMVEPAAVVLQSDFSIAEPLKKGIWQKRQGTRWAIEEGVLRGIESSMDYQASKPDHKGLEARISCPATPPEFAARFSIRFIDGKENSILPFVEFGHHVARVKFSEQGTSLIADGETVKLAESREFKYETGKWYHAFAELKGDEFVIQFQNGPTFYAKHACFAQPTKGGGNGFGTAGPVGGTVEIDDVTIWEIESTYKKGWEKRRRSFPEYSPVVLKEKKK